MIYPSVLDILACPICKGELIYDREGDELICLACRLAYPVRDQIPIMLEEEARKLSLEEYDRWKAGAPDGPISSRGKE